MPHLLRLAAIVLGCWFVVSVLASLVIARLMHLGSSTDKSARRSSRALVRYGSWDNRTKRVPAPAPGPVALPVHHATS